MHKLKNRNPKKNKKKKKEKQINDLRRHENVQTSHKVDGGKSPCNEFQREFYDLTLSGGSHYGE